MKVNNIDNEESRRKKYIENYKRSRDKYKEYASCVLEKIKNALKDRQLDIAYSSFRAKDVDSLEKKCNKKEVVNGKEMYKYSTLRTGITDLAGARIVTYLYDDIDDVAKVVYSLFDVDEEVNKFADLEENKIGYLSKHYIVKLKPDAIISGEEQFIDLLCEVQVRTVLEDAWAQIFHDRQYKNNSAETKISKDMQRKTNLLSGSLELLDYQINDLVKRYDEINKVENNKKLQSILDYPIGRDVLLKYFEIKIGKKLIFYDYKSVEVLLEKFNLKKMRYIDSIFNDLQCDSAFAQYRGCLTGDKIIRLMLIIKYEGKYFKDVNEKFHFSDESKDFLKNYIVIENFIKE